MLPLKIHVCVRVSMIKMPETLRPFLCNIKNKFGLIHPLIDYLLVFHSYGGREGPTAPAIRSRQTASGCVIYRTRQLICRERLMENCLAYRVVTYRARQLIIMSRAAYGKFKRVPLWTEIKLDFNPL